MTYKIISPDKCDNSQLQAFYDLVVSGGQVMVEGLADKIKAADFLSFCEIDSEIVGVASIKNPNPNYKNRVFKKANVEKSADAYDFEIGYAVTKKEHRGKGISQKLIKILMENSNSKSFYATTKVDRMRHILSKIGFKKFGDNYQNDNKESITLYNYDEKK